MDKNLIVCSKIYCVVLMTFFLICECILFFGILTSSVKNYVFLTSSCIGYIAVCTSVFFSVWWYVFVNVVVYVTIRNFYILYQLQVSRSGKILIGLQFICVIGILLILFFTRQLWKTQFHFAPYMKESVGYYHSDVSSIPYYFFTWSTMPLTDVVRGNISTLEDYQQLLKTHIYNESLDMIHQAYVEWGGRDGLSVDEFRQRHDMNRTLWDNYDNMFSRTPDDWRIFYVRGNGLCLLNAVVDTITTMYSMTDREHQQLTYFLKPPSKLEALKHDLDMAILSYITYLQDTLLSILTTQYQTYVQDSIPVTRENITSEHSELSAFLMHRLNDSVETWDNEQEFMTNVKKYIQQFYHELQTHLHTIIDGITGETKTLSDELFCLLPYLPGGRAVNYIVYSCEDGTYASNFLGPDKGNTYNDQLPLSIILHMSKSDSHFYRVGGTPLSHTHQLDQLYRRIITTTH